MAGGVINTGSISRLLEDGVRTIFGDKYQEHETQWNKIFKEKDSDRAYELDVQMEGFAPASVKPEGQGLVYDSEQEGFIPKYVMQSIAKGFIVSKEAMDDNRYELFSKKARMLANSFRQTEEIIGANVLNRAFNNSYTMLGGDGVSLCNTAHVRGPTDSTTFSNTAATPAALSETALEDMLIQINNFTDARGNRIAVKGTRLIVPPALQFQADRVLGSPLQSGTVNNDINALMSKGMLPEGYTVNNYLTSNTGYFIITDCEDGLTRFTRQSIEFDRDRDFGTSNFRFKAFERYSVGWTDVRTVSGNSGV